MSNADNLTLEGSASRKENYDGIEGMTAARLHLVNDPTVGFEEYMYYASITRANEVVEHQAAPKEKRTIKGIIMNHLKRNFPAVTVAPASASGPLDNSESTAINVRDEKTTANIGGEVHHANLDDATTQPFAVTALRHYTNPSDVSEEEWKALSRGIRTAGWSTCFYLITTDILGPFSAPWAFAQMGYGPGVALYTVFGALASVSGFYIWRIFMQMDSDRYPLRDYGAVFFRVFGPTARHLVNVLQSLQLILTVSTIILGMGQSIAQISAGISKPVCFVVCLLIFALIGMVLGQVRTLQRFGWLAHFAVWINLLCIFISMGVAANYPPNFAATASSYGANFGPGPIHTYASQPPAGMASGGVGFVASLNGLNQAVYSYGGAMLFFNFLSEMRHPWDFWKSLIFSQAFIYVIYVVFGIFIYSQQGQFAYNPSMQGLSPYNYQTAANVCYIFAGLIAAALYGNIGIKVIYANIFQELMGAPPLTILRGKILWIFMVPTYWALAFIIAAAIPQFSYVSGLVGAICILSFTYTFPAILQLGFQIKKDAMLPEESFDVASRTYNRVDNGWRRWVRGYMVNWHLNTFNIIYLLGSLTACALGTYSSVKGLISAFNGTSVATSFGCIAPGA